ncbi:hypothetical protein M501DRAFT_852896 [Patellaria atrata CBS 101060]|uniref:Uncharacterized protein n=1 Tax=Patellaria atrata CBS 101060 TaxID=1346257 RepID=A0A9P4VS17_9PEZI|nr:hypothetical protein M501DRAFT_852896 [Patellaria atrata CBS 101060]
MTWYCGDLGSNFNINLFRSSEYLYNQAIYHDHPNRTSGKPTFISQFHLQYTTSSSYSSHDQLVLVTFAVSTPRSYYYVRAQPIKVPPSTRENSCVHVITRRNIFSAFCFNIPPFHPNLSTSLPVLHSPNIPPPTSRLHPASNSPDTPPPPSNASLVPRSQLYLLTP